MLTMLKTAVTQLHQCIAHETNLALQHNAWMIINGTSPTVEQEEQYQQDLERARHRRERENLTFIRAVRQSKREAAQDEKTNIELSLWLLFPGFWH